TSSTFSNPTNVSTPQHEFLGNWINVDPEGGLTKLTISEGKNSWEIEGWGKCQPRDCDWGKVPFNLIGTSISDKLFQIGFASWEFEGASKVEIKSFITVKLIGEKLFVEKITIFTDDSGRSNYRSVHLLKRASKK
ncbi:MAG: hypothetical protein DWQ10_15225, partial [Calditrichaeota bacterium]